MIGLRMFKMTIKTEILSWIENEKNEIIAFLQEFIRAESPNPPGDTTAAANVVSKLLKKHEVPFRWVAPQKTMPNIIGTINGTSSGRHLVLNGHIDVFPVTENFIQEGWITPPWSGEVIEKKIYGRGSTDMKCGTSASIWTYIILNKFKTKFSGKLTLTCVSDEETFGPWGSRWLIDNEPEALGDCCLNGEPSSPFTIRYGEKGLLWLTFKIRTDGSHGAYTHLSKSATLIATDLIKELQTLEALDPEVPPNLLNAQQKSADAFDQGMGIGASTIAPKITLNVGTISGGLKNNMVPSECSFEADIRLPVGCNLDKILNSVNEITKKFPEVSMEQNMLNPPSHCDPDGDMMQILKSNVQELKGFQPEPVVSLGGTDARLWRYNNIPAYVYGPTPTGMGSINENVPIDDYLHILKTHALSAYDYLTK